MALMVLKILVALFVQDNKYEVSACFYENHLLILKILTKTPFLKLVPAFRKMPLTLKFVKNQPKILKIVTKTALGM